MGPFDDTKLQHFQTSLAASGRLAHRNGIYLKVTQICEPLLWEIDTIVLNDELHGFAAKFPGIRRDTQLRKFFTMGRQIPGKGPRRHASQPGQL